MDDEKIELQCETLEELGEAWIASWSNTKGVFMGMSESDWKDYCTSRGSKPTVSLEDCGLPEDDPGYEYVFCCFFARTDPSQDSCFPQRTQCEGICRGSESVPYLQRKQPLSGLVHFGLLSE